MIFSLIVLLALIVFLAFFIGKNLTNVCTFWFFKTFTDLPVAILALIAFGTGVVISILFFLIAKIRKSASESRVEEAKSNVKKKQDKIKKEISKIEKKNKRIGKKNSGSSSDVDIIVQDEIKHD